MVSTLSMIEGHGSSLREPRAGCARLVRTERTGVGRCLYAPSLLPVWRGSAVRPLRIVPYAVSPTAIELSHWKLTLPVDAKGTTRGKATEILPAKLTAGDSRPEFFHAEPDGSIVLWVNGATTEGTESRVPSCVRCSTRRIPG